TGRKEYSDGYERLEYYYSDYKTRYWGNWKYRNPVNTSTVEGCLTTVLEFVGVCILIAFLFLILPRIFFLLPIFVLPFLIRIVPDKAWLWVPKAFGVLLLIGFIISIIGAI